MGSIDISAGFLYYDKALWGRSEAGLSRWPVKPETAGSSPVAPEIISLINSGF